MFADLKLPVNDPKKALEPLVERVLENTPIFDRGRIPDFVENAFRSGRALLLVDGYDELTAEGQQIISNYLKTLLQAYSKTRIAITGAPEYLDGLIDLDFVPLSIAAWNKIDIQQFIQKMGRIMDAPGCGGDLDAKLPTSRPHSLEHLVKHR